MDYIKRQIENDLKYAFQHYKIVLITGARQVGKTRLIKELFSEIKYINFHFFFMHFSSQCHNIIHRPNNK